MLVSVCLALVFSLVIGGTATRSGSDEPVKGNADNSSPMRFALYADGLPETCATACRPLIAASGMITADTARQFIAFVRDNALQSPQGGYQGAQPAATVVLESDGGIRWSFQEDLFCFSAQSILGKIPYYLFLACCQRIF